ncbi:MAG: ATP-binding protein [Gemmatimonadota bacterium]
MLRQINIRCLGPHEALTLDLDPEGTTVVTGPSEVGKSFLMRAVCFALWGCDLDGKPLDSGAIREGHKKAEVTITLKTGTVITRTKTTGGSVTRALRKNGETTPYTTDTAFAAALGKAGNPDLRLAMVPGAELGRGWQALAAGNARALRDTLTAYLPPADLRGEVERIMEEGDNLSLLRDPIDEKGAKALRTEANRLHSEAMGSHRAACDRKTEAEAMLVPTVTADLETQAREVLALAAEWTDWTERLANWQASKERGAEAVRALDEWRKRRAEIGEAPKGGQDLAAACERAGNARGAAGDILDAAKTALRTAKERTEEVKTAPDPEVAKAEAALAKAQEAYRAAPTTDICGTCNRPGWEDAARVRDEATEALHAANAALADAGQGALIRRQKAEQGATEAVAAAGTALTKAREAWDAAEAAAVSANAALTDCRLAANAHTAALRALGPEPTVPAVPMESPKPEQPEPTPETIGDARSLLRRIDEAKGAAVAKEQAVRQAKAAMAKAEQAVVTAGREAARLDALVAAVRQAPSEVARRQAEALGDLGPVSLVFGDGTAQSPAVEVRIDGRAWDLASTGRQIVADAWFRAALRRIMGAPWLAVFVDRPQDVGGQPLPDVEPAVILRTTDKGELRSEV